MANHARRCFFFLGLLVLWIASLGLTATPARGGTSEGDGLKWVLAREWEKAAEAFREVTQRNPANGSAWYHQGNALYQLKRYDEAIVAWTRAIQLEVMPQVTSYNLALAHALSGNTDEAFDWLHKAIDAGFDKVQSLLEDPELAGLRDDPRFEKVVERAKKNAYPCLGDQRYRQFDFWLGQWDVYDSDNVKVGTNSVRQQINGCVLLEHWKGAKGSTGQSINFVDPETGVWRQIWVDGTGGLIRVEGGLVDGAMHLKGEHLYPDGSKEPFRGTWNPLPDGRVRQQLEQSSDKGETWYTWFDGYYVRRKGSD